jgi:hypothetical protein
MTNLNHPGSQPMTKTKTTVMASSLSTVISITPVVSSRIIVMPETG